MPGRSCSRPVVGEELQLRSARATTSRAARRKACWRWAGSRPRMRRSAMRSRASTGVTPRPYPLAMGFYGEQILPRVIDKSARQPRVREGPHARSATGCTATSSRSASARGSTFRSCRPRSPDSGRSNRRRVACKLAAQAHRGVVRAVARSRPRRRAPRRCPTTRFDAALSTMTLCTIPDVDARAARAAPRAEARRRCSTSPNTVTRPTTGSRAAGSVQRLAAPRRRRLQPEPRHHRR